MDLKNYLEIAGLLSGLISAIVLATKNGRQWIMEVFKNFQDSQKIKRELPKFISAVNTKLETIESNIQQINNEMRPNGGGSMKDALKLITAEIEATNWLSPRPTFRTTSLGVHVFVNEAYCQLCGVTPEELLKLGWKNFAENQDQMDDFYHRWLLASKELSQFSGKLRLQNKQNEYRGEWMFRIRLLGAIDSSNKSKAVDYMWHGSLYPYDTVAKDYAKQYNIPLFG